MPVFNVQLKIQIKVDWNFFKLRTRPGWFKVKFGALKVVHLGELVNETWLATTFFFRFFHRNLPFWYNLVMSISLFLPVRYFLIGPHLKPKTTEDDNLILFYFDWHDLSFCIGFHIVA